MRAYRFTLNPYAGCAFGCSYCYARFFARTALRRETWGRWVVAKENAARLVDRACRTGRIRSGDAMYMSSSTDPYQPAESRLLITRQILQVILESGVQPRLTIQTRSPLVMRDVDLLADFAHVQVNMTIGTDSERVRKRYEPRCAPIDSRFEAANKLRDAGIRLGVSVSPMLPLVNPAAFAERLVTLRADRYGVLPLKPAGGWFTAGTSNAAIEQAQADGWTVTKYSAARNEIRRVLEPQHVLREGEDAFAPVDALDGDIVDR
jgi:DNA repair photolyase